MNPGGDDIPRFEFATAGRILFGAGTVTEVGPLARAFGPRALLVTGSQPSRARAVQESLATAGVQAFPCPVRGEPTIPRVVECVALARSLGVDLVIGVGGGSVIDTAKAVAGLLSNPGEALDYLEVVGRGRSLPHPALPWIALPTTVGAGAEVTRNAVLTSAEHRVKVSLRSPYLLARVAIVDPTLALDLPPELTASTGLDALTQLIEPFVCLRPNPVADALCLDGLPRVARALRIAFRDGSDLAARTHLALGALHGGLALANAGLGAVHGLAAPIGGAFPAPHGAVCAALLAPAMAVNLAALRQRLPDHPALGRFQIVARLLTGRSGATAEEGVDWIRELVGDLRIPSLRVHGVQPEHFDDLARKAAVASSMKANPIPLTHDEILRILDGASG